MSVVHGGTNILLNKKSKQSSTKDGSSNRANDGDKSSIIRTQSEKNPYWQGDLQGYYTIRNISVTSSSNNAADKLREALIELSDQDITCPDSQVFRCGQWPDERLEGQTIVFNCTYSRPVRFIRIQRNVANAKLVLAEIEADGEASRLTGTVFDNYMQKKVTKAMRSLSVGSVTGCGTMCHRTQPCLAFSYNPLEQPANCLLATDVTMTSNVTWVSYMVRTCFMPPTCSGNF